MTITFAQARQIVWQEDGPERNEWGGDFVVSPDGWEDADGYLVGRGRRELYDGTYQPGTPDYNGLLSVDMNLAIVAKTDGALDHPMYPDVEDRLAAMTPVHDDTEVGPTHRVPSGGQA